MAQSAKKSPQGPDLVRALLAHHPRSHAEELAVDLRANTPSPLFRWLVASLLFSARISSEIAMDAARALTKAGWITPKKMGEASWDARVEVLNRSGYARYDESTSRMLGETCERLLGEYGGDLRRLREAAAGDVAKIRKQLKAFKGIGDVGADIFLREAQVAWDEVRPFADKRALKTAKALGLGVDARALARRVEPDNLPRLLAALARTPASIEPETLLREA